VVEAATGRILFRHDPHERLPPASLTKMVTAMVALERSELDSSIVATTNSLAEPSVIGLEPGDRLPLREALYGLMLNSGNDVALAIAETTGGGSIQQFVDWMNSMVRSLGLVNTRFANPSGLDIGVHYSSAHDMAVISRAFMQQPFLRGIVGEQRHDYIGPPLWAFRNINPFLTVFPGADGIKTGFETRAGRLLAASATRGGDRIITVVFDSPDYVAESAQLMEFGFARVGAEPWNRLDSPFAPKRGLLDEIIHTVEPRNAIPLKERARLRGQLRSEFISFQHDAGLRAPENSVFDRLKAAANLPPSRL
jgi:D-alanyl-D-alanine carboxypeptidase